MVMDGCTVGASIRDLCTRGDEFIETECKKVYQKASSGASEEGEQILKGIAFPTCISVNNCVCHFSPVDPDDQVLADGDVVKMSVAGFFPSDVADYFIVIWVFILMVSSPLQRILLFLASVLAVRLMFSWQLTRLLNAL